MNKSLLERIPWVAAAAFIIAGILTAIMSAARVGDLSAQRRRYDENTRELLRLRGLAGKRRAAVQAFEELPHPYPVPIAQLLKETVADHKYKTSEPPSMPTVRGWTIRRMKLSFPDVQLIKLSEFLVKAESQRPPWRLVACTIRASSRADAHGEVMLELEALDKTL